MYVSSEIQAPVIIKMLFLCFMKKKVTERLFGGGGLLPLPSWCKIEELVFLNRWYISTDLYLVMSRKCTTFISDSLSNV